MNNIFNINRFGLLIKRQWLDFGKIYLISLLVIAGVLIGFYFYFAPYSSRNISFNQDRYLNMNFRVPLFLILGIIFITIISSSYFASFGQKSKAILELMSPASVFEKFLCSMFYTAVVSIASYLLIFYIIDISFSSYFASILKEMKHLDIKGGIKGTQSLFEQTKAVKEDIWHFIPAPLLITSVFLLGSIYFNRFHYIKTAISVMLFYGIASYIIYSALDFLTSDMVRINQSSHQNNQNSAFLLILLITTALTLIFWAITYVRLKEKEV